MYVCVVCMHDMRSDMYAIWLACLSMCGMCVCACVMYVYVTCMHALYNVWYVSVRVCNVCTVYVACMHCIIWYVCRHDTLRGVYRYVAYVYVYVACIVCVVCMCDNYACVVCVHGMICAVACMYCICMYVRCAWYVWYACSIMYIYIACMHIMICAVAYMYGCMHV